MTDLGIQLQLPGPRSAALFDQEAWFLAPEFSIRRYAERVYDALVALAEPAGQRGERLGVVERPRIGAA